MNPDGFCEEDWKARLGIVNDSAAEPISNMFGIAKIDSDGTIFYRSFSPARNAWSVNAKDASRVELDTARVFLSFIDELAHDPAIKYCLIAFA